MRKIAWITVLMLAVFTTGCSSKDTDCTATADTRKLGDFLKKEVVEMLEKDYQSHNIRIRVSVADLQIDKITKHETKQDNVYFVQGRVSYIVKGKRRWRDREGNMIQLGPEQEITHWFSSGILEDRYLGELFKDDKNRLAFFAENPLSQ